jgi:hypothetical protein
MRTLCAAREVVLKDDAEWGVVLDSDARLTAYRFGDYKSQTRRDTEVKLRDYMCAPSRTRSAALDTKGDFRIAVTLAPPGTGKSRLLDDAMRVPLESPHFDHYLRFAITFNGKSSGEYRHPISVRVLRQFFCLTAPGNDEFDLLTAIDAMLLERFNDKGEMQVSRIVLNAIEALYFSQHGGKLGRTVLMVDEISKAAFVPEGGNSSLFAFVKGLDHSGQRISELMVYRIVATLVDTAMLSDAFGRRGAVITAQRYIEGIPDVSKAGRSLVWLPLGTFDVWSTAAQAAITGEAARLGVLGAGQVVDERVWSLLAATGGRPRDILSMLVSLQSLQSNLQNPRLGDVTTAFFAVGEKSPLFAQYLLPSILNEWFCLFGSDSVLTKFGVDAAFPALLNADLFAAEKADCDDGDAAPDSVPVVSLRYAKSVKDKHVRDTVAQLVEATKFCSLDGSGKDFERAWVLMVLLHLLLQHNVRVGASPQFFWPRPTGGRELGGRERPTATAIDVFQYPGLPRVDALFVMPYPTRVYNAQSIERKIKFAPVVPPTLAIWDDLWVPNVRVGAKRPVGWSMATNDVVWRPSTVVYFSNPKQEAVDFMLLVGDANGTGDAQPHVYMFQCKALTEQGSASTTSVTVHGVVAKVEAQLNLLFSAAFAGHVLRRAGIASVAQVTVCVNALMFGVRLSSASKLSVPFGVVLFDESDFRALGGAALENMQVLSPSERADEAPNS